VDDVQRIRKFILDNFLFSDDPSLLNDDDSFLEKGIVDSTGVLELVAFVEEELGVNVSDDEMLPENLDSVRQVTAFVARKKA
jgi:acyl carrier protein